MSRIADVAIIGAGLIGCAIARELSGQMFDGRPLDIVLIDARTDVGDGTSKANTAILHTGFDATPGTLESRLVRRGYALWREYAETTGVPVERTGALLVAWDDEQLAALPSLRAKAEANGYTATRIVDADTVYDSVPALGPGALGGLVVPDESVMCSWSAAIAMASEAVLRGARLELECRVDGITQASDLTTLHTSRGDISARWVVNAAGLGGDIVEAMFGHERFHLHPRRGELLVFDKLARSMAPVIVLPVPSKVGKGVLVSPTIYGNVMLGPTADDIEDRAATGTTEEGFAFLTERGRRIMPALLDEEVTTAYAGLRAAHDRDDYVIEVDARQRYVVAGCIRSTGLTSSLAVGEHVLGLMREAGFTVEPQAHLPAPPRVPNIGEAGMRPYQDAARIAEDPAYGEIVCFCERVTAGEIRDALCSTIPARDAGGVRRRTRAGNGRCQGFFCGAAVRAELERGTGARDA